MLESIATSFTAAPFGSSDPERTLLEFQGSLERLARPRGVAVVIPIFNAARDLRACLDSLAGTTPPDAEVILVDDHSTDEEIGRLCARFSERWDLATTIRGDRNHGFVHSVNAGIAAADHGRDVVLLNSDTVPTPGWLDKLQRAVALRADTATANPLSNAAGVFSVPYQHSDNALPRGWTPSMCNRVLEDTSIRLYERVPATSGFCLYIRREALDAIGWFDELLLKRGYGEENDFCERATAAGFGHVVDDGTFVYHRRAASFGGSKRSLKAQNARVLKALHPGHVGRVRDWEQRSELSRVTSSYEAAVSELQGMHPDRAGETLRAPRTALVVGRESQPPLGDRVLTVGFRDGHAEIDCFGSSSCRIPVHRGVRAGLVAWLANRWSVQRLALEPGVVGDGEAQRLTACFDRL